MTHVFISYSSKDRQFAEYMKSLLEAQYFTVWMDKTGLKPGDQWWPTILKNIETCNAFVVIMSPNSEDANWVEREILYAEDKQKPIFPVLLSGKPFARLANIQCENMTSGLNSSLSSGFIENLRKYFPEMKLQKERPDNLPNNRSNLRHLKFGGLPAAIPDKTLEQIKKTLRQANIRYHSFAPEQMNSYETEFEWYGLLFEQHWIDDNWKSTTSLCESIERRLEKVLERNVEVSVNTDHDYSATYIEIKVFYEEE